MRATPADTCSVACRCALSCHALAALLRLRSRATSPDSGTPRLTCPLAVAASLSRCAWRPTFAAPQSGAAGCRTAARRAGRRPTTRARVGLAAAALGARACVGAPARCTVSLSLNIAGAADAGAEPDDGNRLHRQVGEARGRPGTCARAALAARRGSRKHVRTLTGACAVAGGGGRRARGRADGQGYNGV